MQRGIGEGCCMEGPSSSVVPCVVVVVAAATAHSTTKFHLSFRLSNFCDKIMLCRCWKAIRHSGIQQQTRQGCHTHLQFSHSAELQKIPSHRNCSQQTKSFPRAQLSLSLSRGTCSIASDTTIDPTKSLVHSHSLDSRFRRLFTRTPSIALSGSRRLLTTKFFPLSRDP
jgi:hypothetical protein